MAERVNCWPIIVAFTSAPGTTAPLSSRTKPLMVPATCACTSRGMASATRQSANRHVVRLITIPPRIFLSEQFSEFSGAVAELVDRHADFVEQRDVQIGERSPFGIHDVPPALETAGAATDDDRRQWAVGMTIAVAESGAVQNDGVVEQRPVRIGGRS